MNYTITDLDLENDDLIHATADVLYTAFMHIGQPDWWPTPADALSEVRRCTSPEKISLIAIDDQATVLGWIAGRDEHAGILWELHPLAIKPGAQGHGVGRALVQEFERQVLSRGGQTIYLTTEDTTGLTSLYRVPNIFDDIPGAMQHLHLTDPFKPHPYVFYQKLGYTLCGLLPDVAGPGSVSFQLAKRVSQP